MRDAKNFEFARHIYSDREMDEIVYRGIRDIIRERNSAWVECQNILTEYIIGDIAKGVAIYAYGEDPDIPDFVAHNLTHSNFEITVDNRVFIWYSWSYREVITLFHEYDHVYSLEVDSLSGSTSTCCFYMDNVIDFITTGYSARMFSIITHHTQNFKYPYELSDTEVENVLRIMKAIRAELMVSRALTLIES